MILLGTELIQKFQPLLIGFAVILLYSAYGLLFTEEDDDDDLSDNAIVKFCRKVRELLCLALSIGGQHRKLTLFHMHAALCMMDVSAGPGQSQLLSGYVLVLSSTTPVLSSQLLSSVLLLPCYCCCSCCP